MIKNDGWIPTEIELFKQSLNGFERINLSEF